MLSLTNKHILLGITGGIAAYKCAELARLFAKAGAEVRVTMTKAATEFVTPLTMQALTGNRVSLNLLDTEAEAAMGHIELARWADIVLVAPATANFIARITHGQADDILSTLILATAAPVCPDPFKPGDWRCKDCGFLNFAREQTCGKCYRRGRCSPHRPGGLPGWPSARNLHCGSRLASKALVGSDLPTRATRLLASARNPLCV